MGNCDLARRSTQIGRRFGPSCRLRQLQQVVGNADHGPFMTDLFQSTRQESAEAPGFPDPAEHRFEDLLSAPVPTSSTAGWRSRNSEIVRKSGRSSAVAATKSNRSSQARAIRRLLGQGPRAPFSGNRSRTRFDRRRSGGGGARVRQGSGVRGTRYLIDSVCGDRLAWRHGTFGTGRGAGAAASCDAAGQPAPVDLFQRSELPGLQGFGGETPRRGRGCGLGVLHDA